LKKKRPSQGRKTLKKEPRREKNQPLDWLKKGSGKLVTLKNQELGAGKTEYIYIEGGRGERIS